MLKKSKLLLAFMPFMLASCGGKIEVYVKYTKGFVYDPAKCGSETFYSRIVPFTFVGASGSKKIKADSFVAKMDDLEYKARHIVGHPYGKSSEGFQCDILDEAQIPSDESVYVAFDTAVYASSAKFYINNVEVTTELTKISI